MKSPMFHRKNRGHSNLEDIYSKLLSTLFNYGLEIHPTLELDPGEISRFVKTYSQNRIYLLREKPFLFSFVDQTSDSEEKRRWLIETTTKSLKEELVILAHELGHHRFTKKYPRQNNDKSYCNLKHHKASAIDKKNILKEEIFAWNQALKVLLQLGFHDKKNFRKIRKSNLYTYFKSCFP
jgi:hypothetical protein